MLARIALFLFALQPVWAVSAASASPATDDLSAKLSKRVTNYNLGVFSLVEALIRVSNDFQIPMGIAWVNTPAGRAELPFAWKNATVQEIIEAIAKTQPSYQVRVKNGVVHVSPQGLIPDRENFLIIKIPAFEVHNEYIEMASFKLHKLIAPPRFAGFSVGATGDSKVNVELKDATVESILDALAVASNRKIWIVTFVNDPKLTITGLRKTRSLFTDVPVPDKEQPLWSFLRWDDPMPPRIATNK
jgi:hypothetical protein